MHILNAYLNRFPDKQDLKISKIGYFLDDVDVTISTVVALAMTFAVPLLLNVVGVLEMYAKLVMNIGGAVTVGPLMS